jgi:hypothetical protein
MKGLPQGALLFGLCLLIPAEPHDGNAVQSRIGLAVASPVQGHVPSSGVKPQAGMP